mgnify:CR=1 FL=1
MLLFCTPPPVLSHSLFDPNAILSSKSFIQFLLIHHTRHHQQEDQQGRKERTNVEKIEKEYIETKKHIYIYISRAHPQRYCTTVCETINIYIDDYDDDYNNYKHDAYYFFFHFHHNKYTK